MWKMIKTSFPSLGKHQFSITSPRIPQSRQSALPYFLRTPECPKGLRILELEMTFDITESKRSCFISESWANLAPSIVH